MAEKLIFNRFIVVYFCLLMFLPVALGFSAQAPGNGLDTLTSDPYDPMIPDDYSSLIDFSNHGKWGLYNVHDPSGIKAGDYYYVYCTDVMLGYWKQPRVGIPVRRSKDLVHFEFVGWAFDSIPEEASDYVRKANEGKRADNIWGPFIMKYDKVYRLYYSFSAMGSDASFIGLAESPSPDGPWVQKGEVVTSVRHGGRNAIDPTVVVNPDDGSQWMAYGSCFGGIFMLQIDPKTGLALKPGDKGILIASRDGVSADGCGKGENGINGISNIEGADITYNPKLKKYFLFVSYDWLGNKYNVRVGRADKPNGPYKDFFGVDFTKQVNHLPIITHPYQFENHPGWAGVGHCGILTDGPEYYMLHQGRLQPRNDMMNLHIRQIVWTKTGWPVVSPERYDPVPKFKITKDSIIGTWEEIDLSLQEYVNKSLKINLLSDGTIAGMAGAYWSLKDDILTLKKGKGQPPLDVILLNAWDWERSRRTIVFTGLGVNGCSVWGKKVVGN
jgi:arabinan endo-1,5-alpha-L-arabinosidase